MTALRWLAGSFLALTVLAVASCQPIERRPLVNAPMNRCPCDAY
ncbi:MAG: hypothetical protein K0S65_6521, partial [Labilithrix sp.]|nr:hypothetical protein [Labilithrix sp.]